MEKLTHISVDDFFWIRFEQHQLNFGLKGLPADVHFTIYLKLKKLKPAFK
jgi:hypothetical protein